MAHVPVCVVLWAVPSGVGCGALGPLPAKPTGYQLPSQPQTGCGSLGSWWSVAFIVC